VNQPPRHFPKRVLSDIRPRVFVAPQQPSSQVFPERFSEIKSDQEESFFESEPSKNILQEESWLGAETFGGGVTNPERVSIDEDATSPQKKSVIEESVFSSVPTIPIVMGVKHSFNGRIYHGHRITSPPPPVEEPEQIALPIEGEEEFISAVVFSEKFFKFTDRLKEEWGILQESSGLVGHTLLRQLTMTALLRPKRLALVASVVAVVWGGALVHRGLDLRGQVLGVSQTGVNQLQSAVGDLKNKNFDGSQQSFESAAQAFGDASQQLNDWNSTLVEISQFIPGASQLASGKYALDAGQHFALAGAAMNPVIKDSLDASKQGLNGLPLLDLLQKSQDATKTALQELSQAQEDLAKVKIDDLPANKQAQFLQIRQNLPTITNSMQIFLDQSALLADVFGVNGPRKYLFLLQNNQEARATGGFIGTYALLDINNGRVRKFFVDGIFNPDGQLTQNIVPPSPLQKVSGVWSLHDSNWFPDFPLSAQKAISFYEKTGGPTMDGVITLTPTVIQKLLTLTGPITLDEYGVTLDSDNFMALVQDQVEFHYDKDENKPKKILADLVPLLLDRLAGMQSIGQVKAALAMMEASLNEKHILLYSSRDTIEQKIKETGWSGEVIDTKRDYLSVINTNISGYKTDGVIDQSIRHQAAIADDGSIVDTVTITRHHTGGNTPYDFWNRVNADYMRVFVPEGSTLLDASGFTRETVQSPLDYKALNFSTDPDVVAEESGTTVDEKTGTRMYAQSGKTVFANWVYVSPGETATVSYKYKLPFRVESANDSVRGSYSVLFQKQSGSLGSKLVSETIFPQSWKVLWNTADEAIHISDTALGFDKDLQTDRFYGIVFGYPN